MIDGDTTANDDDNKDDYSFFDNPPVIKMTPAGNDSDSPVPQRTSAIGPSKEEHLLLDEEAMPFTNEDKLDNNTSLD
jgi:hypothetical protein